MRSRRRGVAGCAGDSAAAPAIVARNFLARHAASEAAGDVADARGVVGRAVVALGLGRRGEQASPREDRCEKHTFQHHWTPCVMRRTRRLKTTYTTTDTTTIFSNSMPGLLADRQAEVSENFVRGSWATSSARW